MTEQYAAAGVNLEAAEIAKRRIAELVKGTRTSLALGQVGAFGGMVRVPPGYRKPVLVLSTDGVGTKVVVAARAGVHDTVGEDIVNHSVDVRKRVGYLAQEPHYYEHMTARETLRFTARFFYSGPQRLVEDRVSEMLELVALDDKADIEARAAHIGGDDILVADQVAQLLRREYAARRSGSQEIGGLERSLGRGQHPTSRFHDRDGPLIAEAANRVLEPVNVSIDDRTEI